MVKNTKFYQLNRPDKGAQDWDVPLNENFEEIDTGLACARSHYREKGITYNAAQSITPEPGYAQGGLAATGNIQSMTFDWSKMLEKTKPGAIISWELKIVPASGISIVWPTNVIWMNGAVPKLKGTKAMRIQFLYKSNWSSMLGSFMGWEG